MDNARTTCRHGETEPHHFTADDYPVPGLWWCAGPDGDHTDDLKVVRMVPAEDDDDDIAW
jgi:hypothetical protein